VGIPSGPGPDPVIVTVYVPVGAPAVTVRVDVTELAGFVTVTGLGLKLAVNPLPLGAVAVSETAPVNPLFGVTVIVEVPDDSLLMLKEVGEAETWNVCTCTLNAEL